MTGLVGGLQADGCGFHIQRAVPHDKPLILRLRQNDEAAAVRPHLAIGFTARQRPNAGRRQKNTGMTEGGLKRRDTAVSGITWQGFSFGTLVEVEVQGFSDKCPFGALVVWNREIHVTGCIFSSFLPPVLFCCERVSQLLFMQQA